MIKLLLFLILLALSPALAALLAIGWIVVMTIVAFMIYKGEAKAS